MSSSPAVTTFYTPSDHRSSVSLKKTYEWTQGHESRDGHDSIDDICQRPGSQGRPSPKDSPSSRRPGSGLQKPPFSPSPLVMSGQPNSDYMKSNPKSAAPIEPFVRDGMTEDFASGLRRAGNRWSFNGSEKIAEPKVATWDLVDEIGKLGISNDSGDGTDGTTTPPKNGMRNVLQIHEASPLGTSSSDTSLDSTSPRNAEVFNLPSHSRESSIETLNSESSARSNAHISSLKTVPFPADFTKDRPRSFSGAISDVELRRLQNIHTPSHLPESLQDKGPAMTKEVNGSDNKAPSSVPSGENATGSGQPMYPSLAAYPNSQPQLQPPFMGMPTQGFLGRPEESHVDPSIQPRSHFMNGNHGHAAQFIPVPANGPMRSGPQDAMPYRQQARGVNMFQPPLQMQGQPSALIPSPTNFGYQGMPNAPGHHNALSLGTPQQMYNLMLPLDPAVNRTQQVFRAGHQHSASDPASLRDAAQLLLSAGVHNVQGMQFPPTPALTPGMYPPMAMTPPVYPNHFFPGAGPQTQEVYGQQDMINAMARAIPPQFTGQSGIQTTPQNAQQTFSGSPSPPNPAGPSANNRKLGLYKTELCRSWEEKGSCRYGPKCQFAHGEEEIRKVARHPKYKTEICRTFWVSGSCPYGKRCCFIHTELPASGTPPGAGEGNPAPPPSQDGRARSMSTNSDPNEAQSSLLARIKGKSKPEEGSGSATPTGTSAMQSPSSYHFAQKPPSGALRVDTNVEAPVATKQNKSAYPTFANTSVQALSPGPVTAGPEFGRHLSSNNLSLAEINQRLNGNAPSSNTRHSYTNSEASISFGQQSQQPRSVSGGSSPFNLLSAQTESPATSGTPGAQGLGRGHSRSGSASNWGSFSQKNHLGAGASPYGHTPSPGNDVVTPNAAASPSPWGTSDLSNNAKHNDRTWS
ncbi:hypothetical protein ACEPAF_3323 [Sanghuangporus sanghuang]